jgi:hypothetical protein
VTSPATPASPAPASPSTPAPAAPASPAQTPPSPASLITTTANGSNHGTKVDLQAVYQAVISGLLTFYQPTDIFHMAAGIFTRDELVAEFQKFVSAAQATKASNQQWRANIQIERNLELNVRELRSGVRGITQARFGKNGAQNLQFGFTLPAPVRKSAETKAVAVAKGLATRKQRNTMGSVQKKDVKGNVSVALIVTPGPEASQPATPATTAPVAPGTSTPAPAPPAPGATSAPSPTTAPAATAPPPAAPAGGGAAPSTGGTGH